MYTVCVDWYCCIVYTRTGAPVYLVGTGIDRDWVAYSTGTGRLVKIQTNKTELASNKNDTKQYK